MLMLILLLLFNSMFLIQDDIDLSHGTIAATALLHRADQILDYRHSQFKNTRGQQQQQQQQQKQKQLPSSLESKQQNDNQRRAADLVKEGDDDNDIQSYVTNHSRTVISYPKQMNTSISKDKTPTKEKKLSPTSIIRQFSNQHLHYNSSSCPKNIQQTKVGVTMVTQATLDRLPFLKETCHQRWSSPIVVVVCLSSQQSESDEWKDIQDRYYKICPHMTMLPFVTNDEERFQKYPINQLRNRGLDQVETSHVFLIDVDFIPSVDLDQAILKAVDIVTNQDKELILQSSTRSSVIQQSTMMPVSKQHNSSSSFDNVTDKYQYHALVVPAFERKVDVDVCEEQTIEQCIEHTSQDPEFIPRSMDSLMKCINNATSSSKCIVFHSDYFPMGHGNTKTEEWIANRDRQDLIVRPIPCIDTDYYEPYLVIPWCPTQILNHNTLGSKVVSKTTRDTSKNVHAWAPLSPYYDERFYGYGKNKMQHILQLQKTGYAFSVIPSTGFLTHHPHPISKNKKHWKKTSRVEDEDSPKNLKAKMIRLYSKFSRELDKEYIVYDDKVRLPTEACVDDEEEDE